MRESTAFETEATVRWIAQAVLAVVALVASVAVLGGPSSVRATATLVTALLAPGAALTGFVRFRDLPTELLFAVVLSLVVIIVSGEILLNLGIHEIRPIFAVTGLWSAIVLGAHAGRTRHELQLDRDTRRLESLLQARQAANPRRQAYRPTLGHPAGPGAGSSRPAGPGGDGREHGRPHWTR